jgi:hypothetical protein
MRATLTLATVTSALAAGVAFGFYRFSVAGQPDVDTQATAVSLDLPAGDYQAVVQAYDSNGNPLAAPALAAFTVPADVPAPAPAPAQTFEAPAGLSVTFG